jgi:hypothetical protein
MTTWLSSKDLALVGNLAEEWDRYHRALLSMRVTLSDNEDTFLWMGGDSSGYLTTKNVYTTLSSTHNL